MLSINNPGNIRNSSIEYLGEITPSQHKSFKTFKRIEFGYRAMFRLINTYISKYKVDTLDKIINRYAPNNENDTNSYISFVCKQTGFKKDKQFIVSHPDLIQLVKAMSTIENGVKANLRQIETAYKLINCQSLEECYDIIKEDNNDLEAI